MNLTIEINDLTQAQVDVLKTIQADLKINEAWIDLEDNEQILASSLDAILEECEKFYLE